MTKTNEEKCKDDNYCKKNQLNNKGVQQTNAKNWKMSKQHQKMITQGYKSSVYENLCTPSTSNLQMTSGPSPQSVITGVDKVVKEERPDEAEINELAAKMRKEMNAKMILIATTGGASRARGGESTQQIGAARSQCLSSTQRNFPGTQRYLNNRQANSTVAKTTDSTTSTGEGTYSLDYESRIGRFGWTSFDNYHVPYIFRGSEKYCSTRILEFRFFDKYLSYLHSDIYDCMCIKSYYITDFEMKLFNEINIKHCNSKFGRKLFSCNDHVVKLSDAKEFYTFLKVCYITVTADSSSIISDQHKPEKCGFVLISKKSVVPYTVKDGTRYVPLFFFEGEMENFELKVEKLEGWDLSYMKFCCKLQGIKKELIANKTCFVISLNDIKRYLPPDTVFEDFMPYKDSQLIVINKDSRSGDGITEKSTKQLLSNKTSVQNNNDYFLTKLPRSISAMSGQQIQLVSQLRQTSSVTHPEQPSSSEFPINRSYIVPQTMFRVVQVINKMLKFPNDQPALQTPLVSQTNSFIYESNPLNVHNVSYLQNFD